MKKLNGGRAQAVILSVILLSSAFSLFALIPEESSALTSHSPIAIQGDSEFTAANGVVAGSGTSSDPYLIQGWQIDATSSDGIVINGTTAHFEIRDCIVRSTGLFYATTYAIRIENATHASVQNTSALGALCGIRVLSSTQVKIENSTADTNKEEIRVSSCSVVLVANNRIGTNGSSYVSTDVLSIVSNSAISRNTVYGGRTAVNLLQCSNAEVTDNELVGIRSSAFDVYECDEITILRNTIQYNEEGLTFDHSSHLYIRENEISECAGSTSFLSCYEAHLESNTILRAGEVHLFGCTYCSVFTNNISYSGADDDVFLRDCTAIEVAGNEMHSSPNWGLFNGAGVWMENCSYVLVNSNSISADGLTGLVVVHSTNCNATANSFTNGGAIIIGDSKEEYSTHKIWSSNLVNGKTLVYAKYRNESSVNGSDAGQIIAFGCRNLTVTNLSLQHVPVGIELAYSNGSSIANNSLKEGGYGLMAFECDETKVVQNIFDFNRIGVWLNYTSGSRIYHNEISGNLYAYDDQNGTDNRWDNGYPSGGNYWGPEISLVDKFSGPNQDQKGSDGIGDTAYGLDRYPLMAAYGSTPSKGLADWMIWAAVIVAVIVVGAVVALLMLRRRGRREDSGEPAATDRDNRVLDE